MHVIMFTLTCVNSVVYMQNDVIGFEELYSVLWF